MYNKDRGLLILYFYNVERVNETEFICELHHKTVSALHLKTSKTNAHVCLPRYIIHPLPSARGVRPWLWLYPHCVSPHALRLGAGRDCRFDYP